jgi:hypothetical protein
VGRFTPGRGIETSIQMGSDQTAAEALQEAETEVGVGVMMDRGATRRAGRAVVRSAISSSDLGLTA